MTAVLRAVVVAVIVFVVVALAITIAGTVSTTDGNLHRGPVSTFTMEPTAYTTTARCHHHCRHRGRISKVRVKLHRGKRTEHTIHRSINDTLARAATIYCRTERGTMRSGNPLGTLLVADGTIRRCWNPSTHHILKGPNVPDWARPWINHSCGTTDFGAAMAWHCENQGTLTAATDSRACDGGCWDYMFRRWGFSWERQIWIMHFYSDCFVQVTANGLGEAYAGRCEGAEPVMA